MWRGILLVLAGQALFFTGMWVQRVKDRHERGLDWKGNHRGYMR